MDSPGKGADEKTQKKTASNVATKEGDSLALVVPPSTSELEKGERPSRRKKRRSATHKRAPVSPEGPFPKGAAEIHPSELEYNPADSTTIIGKGMYGTVYEGRCRGLRVAIKVLNDQKMDAKSLRKFKDEVELMAGLNHTRVVLFLGACMLDNGKVACVTEYLPNGNLETVLESKDIQLTMLDKLKYARDIALGCNWLHHSNPVIIHRDLKPSNLLLDDNGRVKVCDFGLSLAQPEHSKGFRSSRIVGTPLYTSPETIKGKTITTKADVYSYGVVLWQILTRLEPFLECEDSDEVYEVVKKGQRPPLTVPPLPSETTPALRQLIADCWQNSPRKRPTFDEILTRLEVMLIEYAIPDPHGAELWKSRFLGKDEVSWPKFVSTFAEDDRFGAATISPHSPPVRCLKNLLATEASPTAVVTLKSFGDFCSWFGPLVPGVHDEQINITKKVVSILRCPWFHGSVTNKQARSLLVHQPIGTFLVRYNESVRGGWIISYVAESSDDGSSEGLSDSRRKSRKSVASEKQVALASGVDDDGAKRGRIKHVRIYFDRSQPDLGYQLLLPAKPKALQDMPSPRQSAPSASSAPASAGLVAGDAGSQSQTSSSSSLGGGEGGETMGEAFKRYVWSSYTTYIVDFINQLLDKSWPGREYLDLHYPCPGSRFASIFAQSSPGEESSDSVLGGSVLVRYLNSMSSVDDLKRKDKKADDNDDAAAAGDSRQLTGTATATADTKASPHAATTAVSGVDDGGKSSRREQLWQKLEQNGREAKENGREKEKEGNGGGGGGGGGVAGEGDEAGARHVEKAVKKTKKAKKAKDGGEKPEKRKAKANKPTDLPAAADDDNRQPPADNGEEDATPRKKGKKKEKKEKHHNDLNSKDRPKKEKKDKKEKKSKKEKEKEKEVAAAAAEDHVAAASATSTSTSQSPSPGKGSRRTTKRLGGSSKKAEQADDVAEVATVTTTSSTTTTTTTSTASITASPEKKSKKEGSRLFRRKTKEPLISPTTTTTMDPVQGDDGKSKEAEPQGEKDEKALLLQKKGGRKRGLSLSSKRSRSSSSASRKTDDTITSASSGAPSSPLGTSTPSAAKRKEKKDKAPKKD